jgi:hypothetical protein
MPIPRLVLPTLENPEGILYPHGKLGQVSGINGSNSMALSEKAYGKGLWRIFNVEFYRPSLFAVQKLGKSRHGYDDYERWVPVAWAYLWMKD